MYVRIASLAAVGMLVAGALGEVTLSLTPDDFIAFTGTGETISGLEVKSPAGALIPIPPESASADPFTFLLANEKNQIVWGNLGSTYTLDGQLITRAGFNRSIGDPNLSSNWGDGPIVRPVTISADVLQPCTVDCPLPDLVVGLNNDARFQLTAAGHKLEELNFRSPSGSLDLASSPAPFTATTTNTPHEIKFSAGGSAVTIDGQVTLNAGWNNHLYTRDIVYDYREQGGTNTAEKSIPLGEYSLPNLPTIGLSINDEHYFVLQGNNHPVTELTVWSRALVPGTNAAPFASHAVFGDRVTYAAGGTQVNIDGSVVLDLQWDVEEAKKDVFINAEMLGDIPAQTVRLSGSDYPHVPDPPAELGIVVLSLDPDNNFVISGNGVDVAGLLFESASGSLRPVPEGNNAAPFQFLLNNTTTQVVYGSLGEGIHLDGSLLLGNGWDAAAATNDLVFQWGHGATPVPVAIPSSFYEGAVGGGIPAVSVDADRGIVLSNFDEAVKTFTFTSANGSLSPLDIPDTWSIVSNTDSEITFDSEVGIAPEEIADLHLTWASTSDNAVFVSFTLLGGASYGPFSLGGTVPLVPEPTSLGLLMVAYLSFLTCRKSRKS